MVAASKDGARYRPALLITIRPRLFEGGAPAFLAAGNKVAVQIGSGADAGQLRIIPRGTFTLGRLPKGGDTAMLRIPVLPHQQPGKQKATACEFDFSDTWLSITLPTWCRPKPAVPQPPLSDDAAARLARRAA
jgi:hypothetical protein